MSLVFPMAMFQYCWASVSEGAERTLGGSGEAGLGDAQGSFNPRSWEIWYSFTDKTEI